MLDAEAYQQEIINPRDINPSKKRKYNNFSESDHDASSNENIDKKTLPKMSQPDLSIFQLGHTSKNDDQKASMRDPQSRPGLDLKPITPEISDISNVDINDEDDDPPNKSIMNSDKKDKQLFSTYITP